MTLQGKIIGLLIVLLVLMGGTDYVIDRLVVFQNYVALEKAQARKDLDRCLAALNNEIDHLKILTDDWAVWDDTYQFIQDRNADYIESNLVPLTFFDNKLNLIAFYDLQGNRVWGQSMDLSTKTPISISPFQNSNLPLTHALLQKTPPANDTNGGTNGIFITGKGPMLVSSKPILTSNREGPVRGHLVMGQLLTPALIDRLVKQTRVRHNLLKINSTTLEKDDQQAMREISKKGPVYILETNDTLKAYAMVPNLAEEPALLMRVVAPREISKKGIESVRYGVVSGSLMFLSFLLVVLGIIKYTVLQPILALTRHAVTIRDSNDLSLRQNTTRRDEIGVLSREFDRLVAQQQSIQKGLKREIEERHLYEKELDRYHQKLRHLSSELLLTEERERRKIATDLHDSIGQSLAMSKMRLDELTATMPPSDVSEKMEQVSKLIEKSIQDTRTLTFELSPPILYEFGLSAALKWLSEKFSKKYQLNIKFDTIGSVGPKDTALRVMLFQATRELLYNVVKHAHERDVILSLTTTDTAVEITIEDNGVGFDPTIMNTPAEYDVGFGLFSIKERLQHVGGRFEIDSTPGKGTRVCMVSPLASPPPDSSQEVMA